MPIQDGATALIISANGGNESVMALLLDAKADLNHANSVRHFSLSTRQNSDIISNCCTDTDVDRY